jgi:hypothetical protein
MSDIVERARLVQRVNAHWSDSICECEECTEERFGLITPMANEIESLRSRLAEAEAERALIIQRAENAEAALVAEVAKNGRHAMRVTIAQLQARLAETEALLRPCPHCGMALALCYDAKRTGKIACCPDCRHDAHLAREGKP